MIDRHKQILKMLLEYERLTVEELSNHFGVTDMTIRRDLQALEDRGLLTRTHGGCILRSPQVREMPFQEKEQLNRDAKESIARTTVSHLQDGCTLYLDTGTTCAAIARLLSGHRRDIRVFTNNLPAALSLFAAETIEVVVLGGALGGRSPDLTGNFAIENLRQLRLDVAIVGADAVDTECGEFYAADLPTATLSRMAQERARQTFACIDSSKFGKRSLAVAGELGRELKLFTDNALPNQERRQLNSLGVNIMT